MLSVQGGFSAVQGRKKKVSQGVRGTCCADKIICWRSWNFVFKPLMESKEKTPRALGWFHINVECYYLHR